MHIAPNMGHYRETIVRIVPSLAHSRLSQVWYKVLSAKFGTFLRVRIRVRALGLRLGLGLGLGLIGNMPQFACSNVPKLA